MGKKTNWTTTEDQTLCRVWLSASDLQLHGVEQQKASNFWNVVMELFHQEMESPVERPLNGLKVRWTRINRDSQKFASIFNEIQDKHMKQAEESEGDSSAAALLTEQPWIDDAKVIFHRMYNTKFSFEACWKQLRYSAKWVQLFASSSTYPVIAINALSATPSAVMEESTHAEASSDTSSEAETVSMTENAKTTPPESSTKTSVSPDTETVTPAIDTVSAVDTQAPDGDAFIFPPPNHKRRADVSLESYAHVPSHDPLQGLTTALIEELKRQNDLMEDQNTIALLKMNGERILDADNRQCYQLLRARYLERARNTTNTKTSTIV